MGGGGGGQGFWLSTKSVSNTLSCCCFVWVFKIGQYYSGNNMSSKSGQLEKYLFLKLKSVSQNSTPENRHAYGECFWCFYSHPWRIKTLPQSPICTEEISLYTVHVTLIIIKFVFFGIRNSKMFCNRTLRVLKCFMTRIRRQSSEELTFSFIETLLQSLWYVTASGTNVLFYCQMTG